MTIEEEQTRRYATLISEFALKNDVPPSIVAALIHLESGGNPNARSPDNGPGLGHALGLMQVLEGTFAPGINAYEPSVNIAVGTHVLRTKIDAFGGRLVSGIAGYFGAVDAQGNPTGGSDVTGTTGIQYVQDVLALQQLYLDLDLDPLPGARVDDDFKEYAPNSGTWREAAINLKGVATDALEAGRRLKGRAQDSITDWGNR